MSVFLNEIAIGSRPGFLIFAPLFLRRANVVLVEKPSFRASDSPVSSPRS
jgi:hypothetical protein